MKIAYDATPLLNGAKTGIAYCEQNIISAIQKLFPENEYIPNAFSSSLLRKINRVISLPYSIIFPHKADITHFFDYIVPPNVSGKVVTTIHDMAYLAYPETVRFKTRKLLELKLAKSIGRANKIMTISEFSKSEIISYLNIPEEKIFVSHMGVNTAHFYLRGQVEIGVIKQKYKLANDYLLYAGTIEPRKNIKRLLRAYATLKDAPQLILAGGNGWLYEPIYKAYDELKLGDRVRFLGYVPEEDLPILMSGAIAFLFPSLYEGFGMPPLEAMACGTPVVVSDATSLPEVCGEGAVYCKAEDVASIAQGIVQVLANPVINLEYAKSFTWERTAKVIYNEYLDILEV